VPDFDRLPNAMKSLQPSAAPADDARYQFERTLGQGGAGAVYLVRDRETGEQLALKKLLRMDAKAVLRLKREFRSLADMHHPNLVKLYDLGHASDAWFLTMEYVPGTDLLSYIDREPPPGTSATARLLATFHELACGVRALHRAGMLHRDLKPSNVLVSDQDRVVVLDFGLVRELEDSNSKLTEEGAIAGTPAYMAPEQALDKKLGEACDWYAFGVMLYEALSGELPFDGGTMQVLRMKLAMDPPALESMFEDVPNAIGELCMKLLRRDPSERPSGEEILRTLATWRGAVIAPIALTSMSVGETTLQTDSQHRPSPVAPLFGREAEVEQLWDSLGRAQEGQSVVVHVRGASGAGKSALVEQFLSQVELSHGLVNERTLALRSRCYERESMPFKALDGVMDALVRHLAGLSDLQVGHLLPTDIAVLARLFPVLERLPAVQQLLNTTKTRADAMQDRQRAEHALRELFGRMAARTPLVLWIDDLQWGDLDSASILASWLDKPYEAPLLLVFSYRSDEVTTSSCLQHLLARDAQTVAARANDSSIAIRPLESNAVEALCAQRLGTHAQQHPEVIERIVREAQGSPFLAFQLAALAQAKLARGENLGALSLTDLVEQTSVLLPDEAKQLLATLAVAGRPMLPKLALRAAGIKHDGRAHLHALRGLNLVRTRDAAGERLVEVYHDRVRERVQASLTPVQSKQVHENLLRAVEFSGQADSDWLYTLAVGASQRGQALHYGLLAAARASETLAFQRAAELYEQCLELSEDPAANGGEIWCKLAVALACCGRGARAADAYLEAAKHAPPEEALTLTRFAASHLVRSGRFEDGEVQVRKVLDAMEIRVPDSEGSVMASLVWEHTRLAMRGLSFKPRKEQELPANLLARLDLFETLSIETQAYDPLGSALFGARGLRMSLDAGEPKRIVRALCSAAIMAAVSGSANAARRSEELLTRAAALQAEHGTEREHALVYSARAVCAFMLGRPQDVLAPSYEAERLFRADSGSDYYRRFGAVSSRIGALYLLGDHRRFLSEFQAALQEARATENTGAELNLLLNHTVAESVEGHPERSKPRLEHQRTQLPKARFGLLHALHLAAVLRATIDTFDFAWGDTYCDEVWPLYERSPVRRTAFLTVTMDFLRMRMLLNRHVALGGSADPAALVRDHLRRLTKLSHGTSDAIVAQMRARLALFRGEPAKAIVLLQQNAASFDPAIRREDAAREQHAMGTLLGGAEGSSLREAAERSLRECGFPDPLRDMPMSFPELYGSR
jgi:tetratricopeptide (TPR) repeat protein